MLSSLLNCCWICLKSRYNVIESFVSTLLAKIFIFVFYRYLEVHYANKQDKFNKFYCWICLKSRYNVIESFVSTLLAKIFIFVFYRYLEVHYANKQDKFNKFYIL